METTMAILGLVDAQNVPIAVLHYVAPAVVLLWFIFASAVPVEERGQRPRGEPSNLVKWIFALTILTFVWVLGLLM
jgi:hypothetical protein